MLLMFSSSVLSSMDTDSRDSSSVKVMVFDALIGFPFYSPERLNRGIIIVLQPACEPRLNSSC